MTKTALLVRHVPYEGIAGFREPIEHAGYTIDRVDVTDPGFADIDFDAPDLVVLMGGPMGVYDRHEHPWIAHEIERVAGRLARDCPTLGICLGAQMIAAALDARVYPGGVHEIGFTQIELTPSGQQSPLTHLQDTPILQWHGDTFDLPHRTEWLASSATYPHQAFRRGPELLALQFHAEMGLDPRVHHWIAESGPCLSAQNICERRLAHDYDQLGPSAVAAGQAMIAEWLGGLN
ncbi:glutamine amidotransferase [Blastomonas sp.]|uniref:glutamine amidotransferase n=1 Tax=Blastomonas sp. TaxID=1909299 RepID=UPI002624629B|nr:glutamine amidotransferase [Blastomonas sp.]MDM7957404.1 glutamine amidotransferase [Blastomonas sp.]